MLVRTLFGRATLGSSTAADAASATFRVTAERGTLDLELAMDAAGRVVKATWTPRPVRPPLFDAR